MSVNRARGEVAVDIEGKPYVLVYDLDALASIESELQMHPLSAMALIEKSAKVFRAFLLAGLKRHHPEITAEDVGKMYCPVMVVGEPVMDALDLAYLGPEHLRKPVEGDDKAAKKKR